MYSNIIQYFSEEFYKKMTNDAALQFVLDDIIISSIISSDQKYAIIVMLNKKLFMSAAVGKTLQMFRSITLTIQDKEIFNLFILIGQSNTLKHL